MPSRPLDRVDPRGTGDPAPGILAVYLDRALRANPGDYRCPGEPERMWALAQRVLDECDQARAEQRAIDTELDDAFGGLL